MESSKGFFRGSNVNSSPLRKLRPKPKKKESEWIAFGKFHGLQGKLAGENFGGFRSVFVLCVVFFFCWAFKEKTHQTSQKWYQWAFNQNPMRTAE